MINYRLEICRSATCLIDSSIMYGIRVFSQLTLFVCTKDNKKCQIDKIYIVFKYHWEVTKII